MLRIPETLKVVALAGSVACQTSATSPDTDASDSGLRADASRSDSGQDAGAPDRGVADSGDSPDRGPGPIPCGFSPFFDAGQPGYDAGCNIGVWEIDECPPGCEPLV
ncbi:MAG: hypothetical protein HY791_29525 [Deltaproteobacteria bacterium]|nr:hypothetical protein [Deltaproteobacteria bacterium]